MESRINQHPVQQLELGIQDTIARRLDDEFSFWAFSSE